MIEIQEYTPLADFTTLKLGGVARYFVECRSSDDIRAAMNFARANALRLHVLGGGSNTIFLDEGFKGLVLRIGLRGTRLSETGKDTLMTVAAGEHWDDIVKRAVQYNLSGIECLSGIPGFAGATPIQNVGAYGQEVAESIVSVQAIDRSTLKEVVFSNEECKFAYRTSRFNGEDIDGFIITEVVFRLRRNSQPQIRYPELHSYIESNMTANRQKTNEQRLAVVRESVLALRRKKSMVIDSADPNSRSVGSFFKNALLTHEEFAVLEQRCKDAGIQASVPTFVSGDEVKVPAAWLVEHAGFIKGHREGGVGVSSNHTLALVNHGGTTAELLLLAEKIQMTVFKTFGIRLEREPIIVR